MSLSIFHINLTQNQQRTKKKNYVEKNAELLKRKNNYFRGKQHIHI